MKVKNLMKLKDANYKDMKPSWWPEIHSDDREIYDRMLSTIQKAKGVGPKERAKWHRYIIYALER